MSCTSTGPMAQPVVVARVIRVGAAARGKSRRKHVVDGKTEVRPGRVSRGRGQRPLRRRHDNVGPSPAARRRRRRPRGRVRRAAHHHAQRGAPHQTQSRGCATPLVSYRWHLSGWVGRWSRWVELDDRLKLCKREGVSSSPGYYLCPVDMRADVLELRGPRRDGIQRPAGSRLHGGPSTSEPSFSPPAYRPRRPLGPSPPLPSRRPRPRDTKGGTRTEEQFPDFARQETATSPFSKRQIAISRIRRQQTAIWGISTAGESN